MPRPLAIEVSESDAKIVQLSIGKKGEVQLEAAFRVSFEDIARGEEGQGQRVARLKEALKQHRLPADEAVLVISKQSATVRKVRLPSGDSDEIASMIVFEAEKIIPFNVERHIISHRLLRQHEIEGSDVLIAAVDEPVMQQWYGLVKGAGVEPMSAVVSSLSLDYGLMHSLAEEERRKSIGIISIGGIYCDIVFFSDQMMVATRSVKHGVRALLDELNPAAGQPPVPVEELRKIDVFHPERIHAHAASPQAPEGTNPGFEVVHDEAESEERGNAIVGQWIARLSTHLQRTYEFALREYSSRPLEKIYLSGEGAIIPHLAEALKKQFGIPFELYNPLQNMPRAPKGHVDDNLLPAFGTAYGAALELGLESGEDSINLLPPTVLHARRQSELRLHYIATATMALIAAVVIFLWFDMRGDTRSEQVDRYGKYTRQLDEVVTNVEGMKARMGIIRDIRSERAGALQILDSLSRYEPIGTFPPGRVSLDSFAFSINDQVRLSGQAIEIEDLNKFLQFLRTMQDANGNSIFEDADIITQEPKPLSGRDRTVYRFDIVAKLKTRGGR